MKMTFVLMLSVFMHVSAGTFAQKVTLSEQGASIDHLLRQIRDQTGYDFIYNPSVFKDTEGVDIQISNAPIDKALDLIFAGQQVTYIIDQQTIVVKKKEKSQILPAHSLASQADSLRGKVTDTIGYPLPGVSITIKGTSRGTSTDAEGNYVLNDIPDGAVLVFTFLGFRAQEIPVGGKDVINAVMRTENSELDQVVVIGYGTQLSRDVTGAVSTLDMGITEDLPVSSIDQKIVGQAAGVQVQQLSGTPGGGTSIKIRGSGSLGAGNEPLYVIDGMPYSAGMNQRFNPLLFINPNDIESISILKDASSTAIYGSRGANGVIMITTKKGRYEHTQVNVSSVTGMQQVPQQGRPELLNARGFAELQRDRIDILVRRTEGREPIATDYPEEYRDLESLTGQGTDWYDLLLQTAMIQDHNISVLKGSKDSRLNFSLGYFKQEGTVRYTGVERFTGKVGFESKIGETFTIGASLQPTFVEQVRTSTNTGRGDILGTANWANPIMSPYDEKGELIPYIQSPSSKYHTAWSFVNPLFALRETTQADKRFQNLGMGFAEWNILPGLKARTSLNTIWSTSEFFQYIPSTIGGSNNPPVPGTGRSANTRSDAFNWLIENTLTYNKSFGEHRFDALLGYTTQKSTSDGINIDASPYADDLIQTINAAQEISGWDQHANEWSMISYLGRINYAYKDRYLLTATFRSDGSSRFGKEKRFAFFPSLAAAWRISEEDFMKNSAFIDNMKLRLSYGESGNNNIGNYSHLAAINAGSYVFGGNQVTASYVGLSNPFLTWEESRQVDAGLDMELFNNRLSLAIDYYYRKSINMLLDNIIPTITGFGSQTVNQGNVRNTGVEVSLGATPVSGDFNWDINMNIAFNRNKIISLNETGDRILSGSNDGNPTHVSAVGKPIGQFFGYMFEGLYTAEDLEDPNVAKYPTVYEGAGRYRDVNGDGRITDLLDYTIIGNPHPDFIFGISNRFTYKNFDLGVIMNGQYGGQVVNGLRQTVDNLQGFFNVSREWANRWRSPEQPGDGKHYGVPVLFPSLGHRMSNLWVEDATYLRIANLTLGYSLPSGTLESTGFISACRIYFTVQNLATFTNYGGANPEGQAANRSNTLAPGFDMTSYPLARTASLGVNVSF